MHVSQIRIRLKLGGDGCLHAEKGKAQKTCYGMGTLKNWFAGCDERCDASNCAGGEEEEHATEDLRVKVFGGSLHCPIGAETDLPTQVGAVATHSEQHHRHVRWVTPMYYPFWQVPVSDKLSEWLEQLRNDAGARQRGERQERSDAQKPSLIARITRYNFQSGRLGGGCHLLVVT